ncbi:MAG: adenylyltransferase/cytidyltransferase family protein, partial [Nanoarchaeota archaeon]|nr:adenylyltransferase/cytidyltransferase family protein [Nanoarchaeota archaeon]
MIGLYIGRFQPFHNGHLKYIQRCLSFCDRIILVLGTIEEHGTEKNPFPVDERKRMITSALKTAGIYEKVMMLTAKDIPGDDEAWYRQV